MRILMITRNFYPEPGAKARRLKLLCDFFRNNEVEYHVITTNPTYGYSGNAHQEVLSTVSRVSHSHSPNLFSRYFNESSLVDTMKSEISAVLSARKFDLIYIEVPPYSFAKLIGFVRSRSNAKVICNVSDSIYLVVKHNPKANLLLVPFLSYLRSEEKRLFEGVDAISTQTDQLTEYVQETSLKNAFTFPNTVPESYLSSNIIANNGFRAVYAGGLTRAYDFSPLMKTLMKHGEYLRSELGLKFEVYGYGYWKKKIESNRRVMRVVTFQKPVPHDRVLEILKQYAFTIIPSSRVANYGIPVKMLESLSIGQPVLYIGEGLGSEVVRNTGCGYSAEDNPNDIKNGMLHIFESLKDITRISRNAKTWVSENRNFSKHAKDYLDFLRSL